MKRFLSILLLVLIALPAFGAAGVIRRDRRRADDDAGLLLDVDFTGEGIYIKRAAPDTTATFTRASSALEYWRQPAQLAATNIPRFWPGQGILIEGADTNVVWYNTVYDVLRWTVNGNITPTDDVAVNLYDGHSFKLVEAAGAGEIYQNVTLTAVKYGIEFLAYTGSAVTSADVVAFADTATTNEIATTTFEHVGGNVYLCWGVFTGTAAAWNLGIEVKANKTVYISVPTCHIAATASEGGDFPRSPIPNTTGASITRAADVLTILGTGNIGTTEGTVDWEGIVPCSEANAAINLQAFIYYKDANNRFFVNYEETINQIWFYLRMGGATGVTANAATAIARGNNLKFRLVYRQASTLDGTNYVILYYNKGSGWSQLCASATQPDAAMNGTGDLGIGFLSTSNIRHWAAPTRRIRIKGVAEVGIPAW